MEEKRKFIRLDVNVGVKWKKIKEASLTADIAKNISEGGICLIANEKVAIGDLLDLEIELPTGKKITSKGKVAWVNEFEIIIGKMQMKRYDVGAEFLGISDEDREEIEKFIFTFLDIKKTI